MVVNNTLTIDKNINLQTFFQPFVNIYTHYKIIHILTHLYTVFPCLLTCHPVTENVPLDVLILILNFYNFCFL